MSWRGRWVREVPGGGSQVGCAQQGLSPADFNERLQHSFGAALRSAGIDAAREDHNIHATSIDSAARDPLRVPWANYPLHPVACARLIGDYTAVTVETSGPALARLLQVSGLDARWVRLPGNTVTPFVAGGTR